MKYLGIMVIFLCLQDSPAYAYLDPGTGSMVIQIIIASIAGFSMCFSSLKKKISTFVKKVGGNGSKRS